MRIVVSLPDQENEFQHLQAADAKEAAARLGIELVLQNAEGSAVLQIQQLLKAIHADPAPQALVVEPLSVETMESVARKATRANIGLALLNCTLDCLETLRAEAPGVPVFAVGSDQVEIGRIQGRQLKALLPQGGHVLYIHGPQNGTCARERYEGFKQETGAAGIDATVLDGHWSEASAEKTVASWLRLKLWEKTPLAAIVAQDDAMARGAQRAIDAVPEVAQNIGQPPLLGIDGVPDVGQKLVDLGVLAATIVMPSNTGPALDLMAKWIRSGAMPMTSVHLPAKAYPEALAFEQRRMKKAKPNKKLLSA
jgi:ABC-type sugar transport system substrate-binding protein